MVAASSIPRREREILRKSRTTQDLSRRANRFVSRHTWTIPLVLLLFIFLVYALNPTKSNRMHNFIFLSYELPQNDAGIQAVQYGKGPWDLAFLSYYVLLLSFSREFIMQEVLRPLARYHGITSRAKQARFMEQAYTAVYFSFMGPYGLYIMSKTPVWYFSTTGMYEGFPHKYHSAEFKFYYLFQAAYWVQQAIVLALGMEKPRRDFKELIAHHIVTVLLIGLSWRFHFGYMGVAIFVSHDISDFFLALSKSFNYIQSPLQGPTFAICIIIWTYLRHYQNLRILYSLLGEFRSVGPYVLDWEQQQYKCWISNIVTFVLLSGLQVLNVFWLYCLLRNGYRFVVFNIAKDDRSEAEESGSGGVEVGARAGRTAATGAVVVTDRSKRARR